MGQAGHIRLTNDTAYSWRKNDQLPYQMEWDFPEIIPPHSEKIVYVEFKETMFKNWNDDSASVQYRIGSPTPSTFCIKAKVNNGVRQLQVDWQTCRNRNDLSIIPLPISGDSHLGFVHDGEVSLIVTEQPDRYFTVMSFNIDKNGSAGDGTHEEGLDGIMNLFEREIIPVPDILLLQEAHDLRDQDRDYKLNENDKKNKDLDRLMQCLQDKCHIKTSWNKYFAAESDDWQKYINAGNDNRDPMLKRDGNAILSRLPFHNTGVLWFENQRGNYAGRNAVYADIQIGQRIIRIYSAHLECDLHLLTQAKQLDELVMKAKASDNSIIGGDFNIPSSLISSNLNFHDLFKDIKGNTCHFKFPLQPDGRFDYILSRERQGIYCQTIGDAQGRSDHQPIWVTFLA
jgi:endonuclease/exonuclease/phosphatase family metal-dependent hydrolase